MNAQAMHFWVSISDAGPMAVLAAFAMCRKPTPGRRLIAARTMARWPCGAAPAPLPRCG